MILVDVLNTDLFNQYSLAEIFGITLPVDAVLPVRNVTYSDCPRDYGVHINERKLNDFFINTGIPINVSYYKASPYEDNPIDAFGNDELRKNKYIIYTYSYGSLYHEPQNREVGHVALLDKVIAERTIIIYDPGPRNAGIKSVDRIDMYEAMCERNAGIYVFEKRL